MNISYFGQSSFLLETKSCTVITDPFTSDTGIQFPKTKADIVTISHQHPDQNHTKQIIGEPLVIDWPGEYQKNNVAIQGYASSRDNELGSIYDKNIIFRFVIENIVLLHLGNVSHDLSSSLLDQIGPVDILFIPTGGHYTVDGATAARITKDIDPSIVIPMHYFDPKLNQKIFGMLEPLETFTQKMGIPESPVLKLQIKREELLQETAIRTVIFAHSA